MPLFTGEVAVGDLTGSVLPRFQIDVDKRNITERGLANKITIADGERLAVGAEAHSSCKLFANVERILAEPPA